MRGNRSLGAKERFPRAPSKKTVWEGRDIKNYLLLRQQRKGAAQAIANRRAD